MGKKMKKQLKVASGVLMLALAGQAMAATDWTTASYNPGAITVGSATATPTAWANGANGVLVQQLGAAATNTNFAAYGGAGLGINNSITPEAYGTVPDHAIDNNGPKEMVLLSFSKAINLTSLNIGWAGGGDADFTVMAFNVNGTAGGPTLAGKTWSTLGSGWTLVGDYQNSTTGNKTITNSYYSSYWLIGAYNPLVGTMAGFTADATADYFKLASVAGTVCAATSGNCGSTSKVPEPGSLALLGLGVMGALRMRKARQV
jgi:hypothetical protein